MKNSIYELIPDEIRQQWDEEDYKILGPESLEDAPIVQVVLINKNETEIVVDLPIVSQQ